MITIFTPTYNRAYIITKLYESLCKQINKNFEWLIVDDGSTDNTEALIKGFIAENRIIIKYIKQPNRGKHIAINTGVKVAKGDLFFIVDSDDYLTFDAVDWLLSQWAEVKDNPKFVGVSGIRINVDGAKIGGGGNFETIDADTIDIRNKYHIEGDLAEAWRTYSLRKYPFPDTQGERFCSEGLIWRRVSKGHFVRFVCKGIYICEYLGDGLTNNVVKIRVDSPINSGLNYAEYIKYSNVSFKEKVLGAINFWRFMYWSNRTFVQKVNQIGLQWVWSSPLGWLFAMKDKKILGR